MLLSLWLATQIAVISHRGEHLSHVENTLPAFQAAIDAGADFFELDVRTTSDGHLVLMHDSTVNRTTNGNGKVREMTFDQIRALDAHGNRVPAFEEALTLAHGKIGVYVDCKDISPAALTAALEKADMSSNVVIYGGPAFLKEVLERNAKLKVMPEAGGGAALARLEETLHPKVVAFDGHDFTAETIAIARKAGSEIYVDRLGDADQPAAWQAALQSGATGIQTDHPAELVLYLRSLGLHR